MFDLSQRQERIIEIVRKWGDYGEKIAEILMLPSGSTPRSGNFNYVRIPEANHGSDTPIRVKAFTMPSSYSKPVPGERC